MRVMVMVKASPASEAGAMPSEALLAEMGTFNEELVKAGVMLAGEGLHPSAKGARVRFSGSAAHRHRRPLRRDQGAGRRLLAVAGALHGRGRSSGSSAARTRCPTSARSRSARCSRPRTSARPSRPSCASRRSGCERQVEDREPLRRRRAPARSARPRWPRRPAHRAIEAVWRIESPRLIAGLARLVRDVGPGRGAGAGRAGGGAGAVAGRRRARQPGRLADDHRAAPRARPAAPADAAASASTRSSAATLERARRPRGARLRERWTTATTSATTCCA